MARYAALGLALHIHADGLRYRVEAFIKLCLITVHKGFNLRLGGGGDGDGTFTVFLLHFRNDNSHIGTVKRPEYAGIKALSPFDGSLGVGSVGVGLDYVNQHSAANPSSCGSSIGKPCLSLLMYSSC